MKQNNWIATGLRVIAALGLMVSFGAVAQDIMEKPLAKEEWIEVVVVAEVETIDHDSREVTLVTEDNHKVTLTVGEEVERLHEVAVGDRVRAVYHTFLRAEFREPTAEELETPLVVLEEAGKAPLDVAPAAEIGAMIWAVVEIVAIDLDGRQVAIQGPRGNYMILPVVDDAVLNNIEIGEHVIMTYAEAVTLTLEKAQ